MIINKGLLREDDGECIRKGALENFYSQNICSVFFITYINVMPNIHLYYFRPTSLVSFGGDC